MQKNSFQVITTSQLDINDDYFNVEADNIFFNYLVIHSGINFNFNLKRIFIHSFRTLNCRRKMYAYDNIEHYYSDYGYLEQLNYSDYGYLEQLKIPFGCKIYSLIEEITLNDDEDKFETILNDTIDDEHEITIKFVKANKNKSLLKNTFSTMKAFKTKFISNRLNFYKNYDDDVKEQLTKNIFIKFASLEMLDNLPENVENVFIRILSISNKDDLKYLNLPITLKNITIYGIEVKDELVWINHYKWSNQIIKLPYNCEFKNSGFLETVSGSRDEIDIKHITKYTKYMQIGMMHEKRNGIIYLKDIRLGLMWNKYPIVDLKN